MRTLTLNIGGVTLELDAKNGISLGVDSLTRIARTEKCIADRKYIDAARSLQGITLPEAYRARGKAVLDTLMREGTQAITSHNLDTAISLFLELEQVTERRRASAYSLAVAYRAKKQKELVLPALYRAVALDPKASMTQATQERMPSVILIDDLLTKYDGQIPEKDAKAYNFAYYKLRAPEGIVLVEGLGLTYIELASYKHAKHLVDVLSKEGQPSEKTGHRLHAALIRAQNITNNTGVEKKARYYDGKAN